MLFPGVDATVVQNYEGGGWPCEGSIENPTTGTILADTGQLAAGIYDFLFMIDGTGAAPFFLQHRNAANDADINYYVVHNSAAGLFLSLHVFGFKMAANERMRIAPANDLVGWYNGSIQYVWRI